MVSENIVNIILKMEDRATAIADKAEQAMKKLGNTAQSSNNQITQSAQQVNQKYESNAKSIAGVAYAAQDAGKRGSEAFKMWSDSSQKAIVNFNRLDQESQDMIKYLGQMSEKGRETFIGMSTKAQEAIAKFDALQNETQNWGNTLDYTRSKMQLLGTNVDSLKGKIQVVGSSIVTHLGNKWETVKGKVSNLASHVKTSLTSALSTVKSKIQSLGDAFSGLGGVISSVMGGIGLAAMEQMTLGASINRERIQTLSHAMLGYGDSLKSFANDANSLWNQMDSLTNSSLVSLDQLSQAASVVKMSTNASKDQMKNLIPVLNDIGQRAILMGKSGDEAMGLMQAAGKGLNGEFEMLRENFGITKEKLKDAGWKGTADDVDGYTQALQTCLSQSGDVNGMMDTTHGKLTRLQKMWSVSARSLGDEFKPYVDQALDSVLKFVDANNDGQVDEGAKGWLKYAAGAMTAASAFATIAPSISPVLQVMQQLWNSASWVKDKLSNLRDTISSMKEKWSTLKDKIQSAKDKLQEFKDKLSGSWNEGKLNTIKQRFSDIKDKIVLAKDKLVVFLGKIKEIAAEKIAGLADKFRNLASSISLAGIKAKLYAAYQWLVNAATAVWNALLDMNPIMIVVIAIMALVAALIYLYNTNDTVKAAIDGLFAALSGVGEFLMGSVVPAFQWLWDVLQPVGEFLMSVFAPVWDIIVQVLTIVWNTIMGISDAFGQFLSGQIDLPNLLLGIWGLLSQAWIQIMTIIGTAILNFAMQVWNYAVQAGTNMLNGVITYISQLPGRFWSYLVQTTSRVIAAGMQWVNSAKQKASEMVNAAVTNVQGLPGKIYTEFSKIPGKIQEAAMKAIQAAADFGKKIIDAVLSAMGIHSPGIAQVSITEEFKGIIGKIKDAIKPAGEYAKQVGSAIVDNFGEPKLSMDTEDLMPYYDLDANPLENVDMANIDLSTMTGGLDSATGMTEETNTMIGESYAQLAMMMQNTLNGMVLADQVAYGNIQTNDITTFQAISTSLNLNLLTMSNNLRTQLNNMLITHKNAMTSANITTRQQLSSMLSETTRVVAEMRSAWSVMADSIISAAARIKNEATSYFNQLASTIGGFYKKLQNPAQWAGGDSTGSPASVRRVGRDPAVMTRITRGVANSMRRDSGLPYTITATRARDVGLVNPLMLEYMNASPSSTLNLLDLIQRGACPNCFAGGWIDTAPANVAYIKKVAREWSMKGPAVHTGVGDIDTGLSFKVKDFEGGRPNISWDSFVRIATAIARAIPYSLYYNSDKYGSWQGAIAAGEWNCYDGASAMVALANACGFGGGYVDCGLNWNGFGHCCAVINGYTFDTTALRQRGGWAAGPCNYSHPAPAGGINVKIPAARTASRTHTNPLEGLFDNNNTSNGGSEEVKLTLEHNVNVNIDGKTENIDTQDLIDELTASVTDKNIIDKIADALIRRDKRIARMGGA